MTHCPPDVPALWLARPEAVTSCCEHTCPATLRWPVRRDGQVLSYPPGPMVAMPAVPDPPREWLSVWGEAGLRRLVHRHITRLQGTPLLADDGRPECLACVIERVGDFVVESCGGRACWNPQHDDERGVLAGVGWPVLLDEIGREIWLVQLWHSMHDVGWCDDACEAFWRWAEPLSLHMLVPRARLAGVRRYPFETVQSWCRTC